MAGFAVVALLMGVVVLGVHRDGLPVFLRAGHRPEVASLVQQGRPAEELGVLQRDSYVDERRLAMLLRMRRLNREASFQSWPMLALQRETSKHRAQHSGSARDWEEAASSLERALSIDPAYPPALRALREARQAEGR